MRNCIEKIISLSGIDLFGFCKFSSVKDELIKCASLKRIPLNAKTIISFAIPYKVNYNGKCNVSKYALVKDYHVVIENILTDVQVNLQCEFENYKFEIFVDNSPIPEVKAAALCGLGAVGDNGLLITKKYGSWVFLGEIVTDLDVECREVQIKECLHCGQCMRSCPNSIDMKDKSVCVSKISQMKGVLNQEQKQKLREVKKVWGCDICQDVCPLNECTDFTYVREFTESVIPYIGIGDYDIYTDRAFQWRKKDVIERNIEILFTD